MEKLQTGNVWKKEIIFFVFCMIFMAFPLCVQAEETEQKVTIYGLSSKNSEKISIPENLPQSYQISAGSGQNSTYHIVSGESAKVSENGLVTPKYTYWKRYSNYSVSVPEGEEYDYYTLDSGETKIEVKTTGQTYNITVNVEDYAITYGDQVMDKYIKENITDNMTDLEIMNAIAKFPASYEYSASCSSVYSMIIYGGGDCWASTSAITVLCEKLGIKAWARNGNKDLGAGSGHMNAMAELNGVYYELEAGYSMNKQDGYRPYDVTVRDSLFSYYVSSNSITIYQYDGYETTGMLQIPETINGQTVAKIADSAFAGCEFSEIKLPDTLTEIGDFAFSRCEELTHINIPASVTVIGSAIFVNCEKLSNLTVSDENAYYIAEGQVIYSKDRSTLVTCPAAEKVTILPTVTKIADYAFYYNGNLTKIVIPASVEEIGEGAFGNCENLLDVTFEGNGLTRIGTHCFRSNSALSVLRIPSSVKSIGAYAFAFCNCLKYICFMGDAPEFGETIDGTYYDKVFQGCNVNACYLENNASWTEEALGAHGGTIEWQVWKGAAGISLENVILTLEKDKYTYTGAYITPKVTLMMDKTALVENTDYAIVYTNNKNVGTATVKVIGLGSYYGEAFGEFTIEKEEGDIRAYVREDEIMENDTTEISSIILNGAYVPVSSCTYTSSNPSVAIVDSQGIIKGIAAGTADITINAEETDNCLASQTTVKITVTHDSNINVVDSNVANGSVKVKCSRCNQIYQVTVPTSYDIYWSQDGYSYSYFCGSEYKVGEFLKCICQDTSDADLKEMEIISHNNNIITITDNSRLNFIADGVAKVTVRPKYHPAIGKTFTFYVGNAKKGENTSGNNNQTGTQVTENQGIKYYDKKTGITIVLSGNGKKEATLTRVDKKYTKGTLKIPNTIKINGKTYKITAIGKNAFKNQKQLKKVVMGKYMKTIGEGAFSGCKKLQTVTVGNNVTAIGNQAFYNCGKLKKFIIPAKVQKIGKSVFYSCKNLKNIIIRSKKLTKKNVGGKAFKSIHKKAAIQVPKSKISAYKKLLKSKGVGSKVKVKK